MKKILKIDISNSKSGGRIYENYVNTILSGRFKNRFKHIIIKKNRLDILNIFRFIFLFFWLKFFFSGFLILSAATVYFAGIRSKNVLIVHHFGNRLVKGKLGLYVRFCESYMIKNKTKFHLVITVADYWKRFFENLGFTKIKVIYNWFDTQTIFVNEQEIDNFKSKYRLNDKAIIYLGNSQLEKGTLDAYNSLKDEGYQLITSGNPKLNLPVLNLNLSFKEYLILLKAASVTVLMSKFPEGWNRIAHESILMRTPVIGSGMGGMRELLENSGQIICESPEQLPLLVKRILSTEKIDMNKAFNYANTFSIERFNEAWLNIDFEVLE